MQKWRTWIKQQGIRQISKELGVTYECVRAWVNSDAQPKDVMKKRLVDSAEGAFGYESFFE